MAYELTEVQKKCITLDGKNILVSAAAGSGKTSVLVERIIRLILAGESVKNMLIVTFTKAAASEMKERIENRIRDEIKKLDDDSEISRLKEELNLIPKANISTFHNFSMEVIRKFYFLIGVDPMLKAMDDTEEEILLNESFNEITNSYFELEDKSFISFIDKYSDGKNLNIIKDMVLNVYNKILSLGEPYKFLDTSVENLLVSSSDFSNSFIYKEALRLSLKRINKMIVELNEIRIECKRKDEVTGKTAIRIDELINLIEDYKFHLLKKDYDYLKNPDLSIPRFNSGYYLEGYEKEDAEIEKKRLDSYVKAVKKLLMDITNNFFYNDFNKMLSDLKITYDDSLFFSNFIKKLDDVYSNKKKDKKLMSFDDMQRFSYLILKHDEASKYYKDKFNYIFIDEYQDTNGIQEAIIDKIKRDNNLFMVGDIKQSIYGFRNADPYIFRKKYVEYEKENSDSEKIDLNSNFRSKSKIIDFVNEIFTDIMDEYDESDKLHMGLESQNEVPNEVKFYIVNKKGDLELDDEVDDIINGYSKAEREALVASKIIKEQIKKGYSYKDIRVLLRTIKTNGEIYYNVLSQNGIPVYIDDSDGFFETIEINTIISLLKVINNEDRDIDLLTIMRSEIFDFSIEELTEIRINGKSEKSYYLAIKKYLEDGSDIKLKEKISSMLTVISRFRDYVNIYPLDELIFKIILESNFYILVGALPSGIVRQANLRFLVDKAKEYRNNYKGTLYDFINYLDILKKNKNIKMGQVRVLDTIDSVTISTIHVSKGLEFNCVILPGFDDKIQYGSSIPNVEFSNKLGFSIDIVDPKKHYKKCNALGNLIKEKNKDEEVDEAKRLLYVALTRAKESLFVISSVKNIDTIEEKINSNFRNNNTYLGMAGKTIFKNKDKYLVKVSDKEINVEIKHGRNINKILEIINSKDTSYSTSIDEKMRFKISRNNEIVKESVTSLNSRNVENDFSLEFPSHELKSDFTKAEIGTLIHAALYEMDLKEAKEKGISYINSMLDSMVDREIILPNERNEIDENLLYNFAQSDIAKRISNSNEVYKEQSFTFKNEEGMLIQGIIDLFFIEDNEVVLLDYKTTSRTNEKEIREEYQLQIDLYKEAIEKALNKKVKEAYLYLTNSGYMISMI